MKMEKEKLVNVNLLEKIKLNEIVLRSQKMKMDTADCVISLFKKILPLNPETAIEELEEIQTQLRAMMNETEKELKIIENDEKFVKMIMDRGEDETRTIKG